MSLTLTLERGGGEVSGSGTQIELEGTGEGYTLESVTMNGDTNQHTYSGKNLYNPYLVSTKTASGIAVRYGINGFDISGTSTARIDKLGYESLADSKLTSGTYTLSTSENVPSGLQIKVMAYTDSAWAADLFYMDSGTKLTRNITIPSSTTRIRIGITIESGVTISLSSFKIQLESGSDVTAYVPFVGGVTSPNPGYPQEVQTATGRQLVTLSKKNLFDKNNPNYFVGYFDATKPYLVPQSGNANNYTFWIPCEPNTAYSLRLPYATSNPPIGGRIIGTTSTIPVAGTPVSGLTSTINQRTQTYENYVTASDAKYLVVRVQGTNFNTGGGGWESTLENLQIERGTTATAYEEFQGQSYEVNLGKNLFDKDNVNEYMGYFDGNADAPTLVSGNTTRNRVVYIPCEPDTTYSISLTDRSNINNPQVGTTATLPSDGLAVTSLGNFATGSLKLENITTSSSAKYIVIRFQTTSGSITYDSIAETLLSGLQIEKGSATTYAPYFTPIELCKIGDYQDYIYKSGEDWYLHKATKKVTLTGSEVWQNSGTNIFACQSFGDYATSGNLGYSTIAQSIPNTERGSTFVTESASYSNCFAFGNGTVADRLYWKSISFANANEFKTWLSSNNVAVYYALSTPTDTQITNSALIAQLDALDEGDTYDGTTVITVSSENLKSSLDVTAEVSLYKTYTEVEIGSPFTIADVEGKSSNTTLDGNVYVDWAYNKKQYSFDLFNLTPQDYADIRAYYDYQFSNSAFPTITVPELNIDKLPVYMEISSRNIINQCLLTDKLTIKFRETVQP